MSDTKIRDYEAELYLANKTLTTANERLKELEVAYTLERKLYNSRENEIEELKVKFTAANERIRELEDQVTINKRDLDCMAAFYQADLNVERMVSDKLEKALNDIAWLRHPGVAASEPVKRMESMAVAALAEVAAIRKGEKQ